MFASIKALLCTVHLLTRVAATNSPSVNTIVSDITRIDHANNAFREHIQTYHGGPNQAVFYTDLGTLTMATKDAVAVAKSIKHRFSPVESCRIVDVYYETLGKDIPLTNRALRAKVGLFRKLGEAEQIAAAQKGFQAGLDEFAVIQRKWLTAEKDRFDETAMRIHDMLRKGIEVYCTPPDGTVVEQSVGRADWVDRGLKVFMLHLQVNMIRSAGEQT